MNSKLYVVTAPEPIRGIYPTWDTCRAAVSGVAGARFQAVNSQAEAKALLSGDGIRLPAGFYAFVDGNHLGGVGVVLVTQEVGSPPKVKELSTSVTEVFAGSGISALTGTVEITSTLARLRNVLAELAGLYQALRLTPSHGTVTIVHDYEGIGAWLTGAWKAKDPTVREIIEACRRLISAKGLQVSFQHQPGHQATSAGRHDFAFYNRRADELAATRQ